MRPLLAVLLLQIGCATILRGSQREIAIYGPANMEVLQGEELAPVSKRENRGETDRVVALIPKDANAITLRSADRETTAGTQKSVGVGWIVADVLLTGAIGCAVDAATGSWDNFNDVQASDLQWVARKAPRKSSPAPAGVEQRELASMAPLPPREEPRQRAAAPPPPLGGAQGQPGAKPLLGGGKLAVLDFKNFSKDLQADNVRYFTDVVRGASLRAAPRLEVMTRENLLVLLQATGKDAAACEGECEVDTGRRIGADAVISGDVLKVGSRYKISLKLHDTHEGRLLSTGVASGKTIDELDEGLQAAAVELLAPAR